MRQDQFESLQQRAEELIDLFISESDPVKWPGAGLEPSAMDKQTRGDRFWCKKDAVATLACAQRIELLLERQKPAEGGADDDNTADLDHEVRAAEKEAAAILNKMQAGSRASKQEFDRRVHGKS